jgi:hypothetical protein
MRRVSPRFVPETQMRVESLAAWGVVTLKASQVPSRVFAEESGERGLSLVLDKRITSGYAVIPAHLLQRSALK